MMLRTYMYVGASREIKNIHLSLTPLFFSCLIFLHPAKNGDFHLLTSL